jgi:hypothetical protein
LGFWLDTLVRRVKIPYPAFFGLIALASYLLGIPVMIATGNLERYLVQLNWVFLAVIGAASGIFVVFVYRKFLDALEKIKPLVSSEEEFDRLRSRATHRLTHWLQWVPAVFWIAVNLFDFVYPAGIVWDFFASYDQLFLVIIFYQIAGFPSNVFGGIFMYVIPFGLTLAYREICVSTAFAQDQMLSEWMSPFRGIKNLITIALLISGIYAIFAIFTYYAAPPIFLYGSILLIVVPTLVFPHYYFHVLFSRARSAQLSSVRQELLSEPIDQEQLSSRRMLLLLEEARIERKKTWLVDIVTIVEILIVALMHVLLVEILTMLFHI